MPSLTLNGQPVDIRMDPQTPLLWGLRDGANLTGSKYGCGTGECGACMVLIDGEARASCALTLAEADGREVTTIEGLSKSGQNPDQNSGQNSNMHPMQQAMVAEGAIQCGFCTPGIIIAGAALIARNADPGEAEIKQALTNLCRCGVYPRLIRAVQRAGRIARGLEAPQGPSAVPALQLGK